MIKVNQGIAEKDSRGRVRVCTLLSAIQKPSGMKIARIKNDFGDTYLTRVHLNGTGDCTCKGGKFNGKCYHRIILDKFDCPQWKDFVDNWMTDEKELEKLNLNASNKGFRLSR